MNQIKEYLKKLNSLIRKEEMRVLPGHLSFFLLLSIVPILTLVGIICSLFSISFENIINGVGEFIPREADSFLISFLSGTQNPGNLILYFAVGFIVASNGAHSIIIASNTLYHIENETYLKRRIKALFLTIVLILLFLFVLIFLAFGNGILRFILSLPVFIKMANRIYSIFILLKWPTAFLIVFVFIKLLYTMAPDHHIASKYVNKGAMFTTIGWILTTGIYSYYANNIAHYNLFYGGFAGLAVLMIWIYIIAYIFVIGIAINTSSYHYLEEMKINKSKE